MSPCTGLLFLALELGVLKPVELLSCCRASKHARMSQLEGRLEDPQVLPRFLLLTSPLLCVAAVVALVVVGGCWLLACCWRCYFFCCCLLLVLVRTSCSWSLLSFLLLVLVVPRVVATAVANLI